MDLPDKALSVRQPWAWAIIHAGKDIENRSVAAVRHGMTTRPICIHASKGMTRDEYEYTRRFMESIGISCPRPDGLIRGAIIGTVNVVDVVQESESDWFFGPRGLVLSGPVPVDPIPVIGALGYFSWARGGATQTPLQWMTNWPLERGPKAEKTLEPMPLFG